MAVGQQLLAARRTFCLALCFAKESLLTHLPAVNLLLSAFVNKKHFANPPLPRSFPFTYRLEMMLPAASSRRSSTTSGTTSTDCTAGAGAAVAPLAGTGAAWDAGTPAVRMAVIAMLARANHTGARELAARRNNNYREPHNMYTPERSNTKTENILHNPFAQLCSEFVESYALLRSREMFVAANGQRSPTAPVDDVAYLATRPMLLPSVGALKIEDNNVVGLICKCHVKFPQQALVACHHGLLFANGILRCVVLSIQAPNAHPNNDLQVVVTYNHLVSPDTGARIDLSACLRQPLVLKVQQYLSPLPVSS